MFLMGSYVNKTLWAIWRKTTTKANRLKSVKGKNKLKMSSKKLSIADKLLGGLKNRG